MTRRLAVPGSWKCGGPSAFYGDWEWRDGTDGTPPLTRNLRSRVLGRGYREKLWCPPHTLAYGDGAFCDGISRGSPSGTEERERNEWLKPSYYCHLEYFFQRIAKNPTKFHVINRLPSSTSIGAPSSIPLSPFSFFFFFIFFFFGGGGWWRRVLYEANCNVESVEFLYMGTSGGGKCFLCKSEK